MGKFPRVSSNELIKFLGTLGYVYDHIKGDHVILKKDGTRRISVPSRKEMGRGLFLAILAQAGSSKKDFFNWTGS